MAFRDNNNNPQSADSAVEIDEAAATQQVQEESQTPRTDALQLENSQPDPEIPATSLDSGLSSNETSMETADLDVEIQLPRDENTPSTPPTKYSLIKAPQFKWNRSYVIYASIILLGVILVVVISVVLSVGNKHRSETGRGTGDNNSTLAESPTASPTIAASAPPRQCAEFNDIRCGMGNYTLSALQRATSPQFKAYQWVSSQDQMAVRAEHRMERMLTRFALATLYYSTQGDQYWTNQTGWMQPSLPECLWFGCNCTTTGNTTVLQYLTLQINGLNGTIPREIALLTSLKALDLSLNALGAAPLPTELGLMTNLRDLRISFSRAPGKIPTELSQLTNLIILDLFGNALHGPIPTALGRLTNLEWLNVGGNNQNLTGPIPTQLGLLTQLTSLYLDMNALSGTIPTELGRLTNLTLLQLDSNALTGRVPSELGLLTKLEGGLYLSKNSLTGAIPWQLGQLTRLKLLDLFNNILSGSIPTTLGRLSLLDTLNLYNNALSGPLPSEIGRLPKLNDLLGLTHNLLSNTIPTELGLLSNVDFLDLSFNRLTGTIPTELGLLSQLSYLDLSSNPLRGPIPTDLALLSNLQPYLGGLNLGDTQLNGTVPWSLCTLVTNGLLVQIDCDNVACTCGCTCWQNTTDDFYYSI